MEDVARANVIGVWQAETQTPWDCRYARWKAAEQESPQGCTIKGNINNKGEAIYYRLGTQETKIDVSKGAGSAMRQKALTLVETAIVALV